MKIRESGEMYLETILLLKQKKGSVRSVDIVEELGYAKSSVSRAVNLLSKNGYIQIAANGDITLTDGGLKKANDIYLVNSITWKQNNCKEVLLCRKNTYLSSREQRKNF